MKNLTYNGATPQAITYNGAEVKTVTYNGTTVWQKDQTFAGLTGAGVYNYEEYHETRSGISTNSIDARTFNYLTFTWSLTTTMEWSNAYGVKSTSCVYLRMADGTDVLLGEKTGTLYGAGTQYEASGTETIDISGYSESAKNGIKLYVTLGDMSTPAPGANTNRHNLTASTGTITAS